MLGPGSSSGTPGVHFRGQKVRRKTGRRPSALGGGRSSETRLLRPGKGRGGSTAPVWGEQGRRHGSRGDGWSGLN
jgi:hypothetical protein